MGGRKTDARVALILILGLLGVLVVFSMMSFRSSNTAARGSFRGGLMEEGVGLVEILGPIYDSRKVVKQIDNFRTNDKVKALIVRVDSPGGGVAASQELYEAIKRCRHEKPVVVSMGSVAASGGYYCALGADTIVANAGTTTGSIGVIIELAQMKKLMDKIGVGSEVVKSGEFKDTGSPMRDLTPNERNYLQNYVNDAYEQFIQVVSEERHLDLDVVRKYADGRIFTGRQAFEYGLIDVLGDYYAAVQIAGNLCGLGDEPHIIKPPKRLEELDWLSYFLDEMEEAVANRLESRPGFQYIWQP
ncbi:signal peptide peptidase SppA [bacterium]|nr:signal peptide peptidase SppA [bacterium]